MKENYHDGSAAPYSSEPWKSYRNTLTSVKFGYGVRNVGDHAFYFYNSWEDSGHTSLTSIQFSNTIEILQLMAFDKASIESIFIPVSVKTIERSVFRRCSYLKKYEVDSNNNYFSIDEYGV